MKKLCVFTLYADQGASSKYRYLIYKDVLEKYYQTKWYWFWDNTCIIIKNKPSQKKNIFKKWFKYVCAFSKRWFQLVFIAPRSDVIIIQKSSIPKQKRHFLNRVKKKGTKIIFDVDDAVYLEKRDNSNEIATIADMVICGNETLRRHYLQYCKNTVVLPTTDNTFDYESFWKNTFSLKRIGWIGSEVTVDNLELVVKPINQFIKKHPEVHFYIISNGAMDYTKRIYNSHFVEWNKNTYLEELSKLTIGIMPLRDTEYNRGKCGFKLIQYLNMKKPVIGSNVGVNKDIVAGNGFGADTEEEWEAALEKLLFDSKVYDESVQHIENVFFEKYHYSVVAKKLLMLVEEISIEKGKRVID